MPDLPFATCRRAGFRPCGSLVLALATFLAACSDSAAPPPVPASLELVSEAPFVATVGTALAVAPEVVALDDRGSPIAGATIAFAVVDGGGSIERLTARTDADGRAGPGAWTLGTAAGRNVLSAAAAGAPTLSIEATATAGAAASLELVAGSGQTAYRNTAIAKGPSVRVRDAYGNAVAGAVVQFVVVEGGGSVEHPTATSDANGVAAAGVWQLGPAVGRNVVRASLGGGGGGGQGADGGVEFEAQGVEPIAAALVAVQGDGQSAVAGSAVSTPPAVRTLDAQGQPLAGVSVTFSTAAGTVRAGAQADTAVVVLSDGSGVAAVDAWVLGTQPGNQTLTARATATPTLQAAFVATAVVGAPAAVDIVAGNGQTAQTGQMLPVQPTVRVTDPFGNVVAGVTVTFAVTAGGGTITPASATTDAAGIARAQWRLGTVAGANGLTARAGAASASFVATATVPPPPPPPPAGGFAIELRYLSTLTGPQQAAVEAAADRWSSVITGDLPALTINVSSGGCTPAMSEVIDDLVVFVRTATIDGAGGTIASAGPCYVRSGSGMPAVGRITIDEADIAGMLASGSLANVVLHELGHVLGIGIDWNGELVGQGGADPYFTGSGALGEYVALGGSGAGVPVEANGGSGTAYAHWRESVFATEIMTGWINTGRANPLSRVSVGLLDDLGYGVSLAAADAYQLPSAGLKSDALPGDVGFEIRELPLAPPQRIGPDGKPVR